MLTARAECGAFAVTMDQTSKNTLVMNAGDELGVAVCRQLIESGFPVSVLGLTADTERVSAELSAGGASVHCLPLAGYQRSQVNEAIAAAGRDFEMMVFLCHRNHVQSAESAQLAMLEQAVVDSFLGLIYAIEAILPSMLQRRSGSVAAVTSFTSLCPTPRTAACSAAATACATYLESLRPALRLRGIHVSTLFTLACDRPAGRGGHDRCALVSARLVKMMCRQKKECYVPWPATIVARCVRQLPAPLFDILVPRLERFMLS